MKSLKTNYLYNCLHPGYLFLCGLLISITSLWFFQATNIFQHLVGIGFIAYSIFLLLLKYPNLKYFTLLILIGFLVLGFKQRQEEKSITLNYPLVIYPDQLILKDNYASGKAKSGKTRVLINMSVTPSLKSALQKKQTIVLYDLKGESTKVEPATNFGQFDYRKYYAGQNIYEKITLKSYQVTYKKQTFLDKLHSFRTSIMNYCQTLPKLLSFMTSEMLLAYNPNEQGTEILNNYRNLGIIHLLSISGLHVSLYTIFISTICTLLKRDKFETMVICAGFLIIEIFLSDFQPGFVRASLGFILGKIFSISKIPIASGDRLGLVALIHLFFQPKLFFNCGAILSYLLVLGLDLVGKRGPLIQGFLLNLLISPVLLANFYQINVLTLIFNLLVVPIFNFILLPLTFIGAITYKVMPGVVYLIEKIFTFIMASINFLAQTKLGMVTFGKITWWQTIFLLIITFIVIASNKNHNYLWKNLGYIGAIYLVLFISIHFPLHGQVSLIDVGQGDSILITTPIKRKTYLIDTGGKLNFGKRKAKPQIDRITIPYLYAQGINHIDGVFLSHQDADHIGDLGPLLEQVPVKKLYFAQGLNENSSFLKRIDGKIKYTKLIPLIAGNTVKEDGVCFHVIFPFDPGEGKNEDSLSLWFTLANKNWLFTGDLDQEGEKKLIQNLPLKIDYFKLGHHGSKTSSNPEFMTHLMPQLVFVSAGRNNRFGHPHPETLQTLSNLKIPYYTTQDSGTITWTYSPFTLNGKFKTYNQGSLHGTD